MEIAAVWIYVASLQTLEYVTAAELHRQDEDQSFGHCLLTARRLLETFVKDKQWLAALSSEGNVFADSDPEDAQLYKAVQRLGTDARLVSRDKKMTKRGDYSISVAEYLSLTESKSTINFIDLKTQQRHRIGEAYTQALKDIVTTPYIESHNTSVYAQYTIQVDNRNELQQKLKEQGIPTAVHYPIPLNKQAAFARRGNPLWLPLPVAEQVAQRVISLPMHPYLTEDEQSSIITKFRN
jgi:UDP-2-acetamido-2-deoxy-ribo-hexuluronate aminotransferase